MNKRCSEKRRYGNIVLALDALLEAKRDRRTNVVRIYKCDRCLGWHTTSQERRAILLAFGDAAAAAILDHRRVAAPMPGFGRGRGTLST